ncbi:MAG: RagB/SusD family nutrient uptake outer membrane protein [Bacteroidales bacterium]|nr:RagB/SusD family nutrient uptake outer membrane protein [Bacteroidales bacterium]
MKKLSIIALAIAVLVSFGCAKDYLDTFPTSSTSPATLFETTDASAVAVNGLAKIMRRQYGAYGQGYNGEGTVRLYIGDYLGENLMKGNSTSFLNSANGNLYVSNTASLGGYAWYYYYMLIGNANTILRNIDEAEGTDGDRAFVKAQTLTYRAYAYFNLVQIFGRRWSDGSDKPSCVLRLTGEEPDNLDRASSGEVYKQIYADLDEAISLFTQSGKANKRTNTYTMDLDVAYAIYARVALTREDWNNALKYAQLARKNYPLQSVAEERAGFCNPTKEWIWYLYGAEDETLYYYDYFSYASYNAASSTTRNYPLLISRHLFEQIPTTDIRRAWWLDPAGYEGTFNTNTMKASAQSSKNKLWVYGQNYAMQDGRVGILSNSCVFAYMNFKIHNNAQPGIGHLCLFRSSEMVLIEAEAQYRLNNEAAARAALVELNATSKRDPAYTCDKSGAALMQEIKLYRGIELWAEGFNWFDLKRWGDTIDRKKYSDGGNWMSQYAIKITPNEKNNWTWCIPQHETNYNKGITSTAND